MSIACLVGCNEQNNSSTGGNNVGGSVNTEQTGGNPEDESGNQSGSQNGNENQNQNGNQSGNENKDDGIYTPWIK